MKRRNCPAFPMSAFASPTGGGKTVLAAHTVGIAADNLLRTETPCVLWLVPSQPIREQTLATLQNREHTEPSRAGRALR